jgi:hypothetical protein
MNNKEKEILEEIKRFKEVSKQNLNEGIIDDITDYLKSAWKSKPVEKVKDFFKGIMSGDDEKHDGDKKEIKGISTTDDEFYEDILSCIGAPKTKSNMEFFYAWRQSEGAKAKYNPFNTTKLKDNTTFYNCLKRDSSGNCVSGVRNYNSRQDGIDATCETLKLQYYSTILSQLRKGDVPASTIASNFSELETWGTGRLVAKVVDSYEKGATPNPPKIETA